MTRWFFVQSYSKNRPYVLLKKRITDIMQYKYRFTPVRSESWLIRRPEDRG